MYHWYTNMLFTHNKTLAENIVEYLAYHPGAKLDEIQKNINHQLGTEMSRKAWYKAINSLLDQEVIVKVNKQYSLNLAWAGLSTQFAYFVNANYFQEKSNYFLSLDEIAKKKVKYTFPNLLTLDTFWTHVFTLLAAKFPKQPFYSYNTHFWYFVAHRHETERYYESTKPFGTTSYVVVGSRSDIDLWSERLIPTPHQHHYSSPRPITKTPEIYTSSLGDFLVTLKINKKMAHNIDQIFKKTKFDIDSEDPPLKITNMFKEKSPCTMTIEMNKEKVEKFQRKIKRYF